MALSGKLIAATLVGLGIGGALMSAIGQDKLENYTLVCDGPNRMTPQAATALATYQIWQYYGPQGRSSQFTSVSEADLNTLVLTVLDRPVVINWEDLGKTVYGMSVTLNGELKGTFDFAITSDCGAYMFGEFPLFSEATS